MKKGKMTAVVAVRKGSQRIPNKNITPFGSSNLLEMKLELLKKVSLLKRRRRLVRRRSSVIRWKTSKSKKKTKSP